MPKCGDSLEGSDQATKIIGPQIAAQTNYIFTLSPASEYIESAFVNAHKLMSNGHLRTT